jgi:NADH-quinone oxidoreductase subunit E
MLSDAERRNIDQEARACGVRRAAVSEALMTVQKARGWVTEEAITDISETLGLSRAEVESIATSYELVFRRPVGSHVVMVCDSVSCWVTGGERILSAVAERLGIQPGGTTPDGRFTLLPAGCLGACDEGPAMMVDGELFGNLTAERAMEVLTRYGMG